MRVVAGSARGRRLVAPRGRGVRPTTDRVREAVFNALGSLGAVEGGRVLDLFAGSGALGIEALSRGAASAVFVERDPVALAALRTNLAGTGVAGAEVVAADALAWLAADHGPFDLALLDPPYEFDRWPEVLARLRASLVVIESDRAIGPGPGWEVVRARRYGGTVVTFAVPAGQPAEEME
ncbi:MAG: 16S rRNA (guanine(966)-N(2))-methyltransferase RsmD [Acidimicrobiales bacterium]|nr:16S rRNA (guanine(966)-N(2))-methyltransferase RsmD [Acidimicrobiales bacterium]